MLSGFDWWISIRSVNNTQDWWNFWKPFRVCFVFWKSCISENRDTSLLAHLLKCINNSESSKWKSFIGILKVINPSDLLAILLVLSTFMFCVLACFLDYFSDKEFINQWKAGLWNKMYSYSILKGSYLCVKTFQPITSVVDKDNNSFQFSSVPHVGLLWYLDSEEILLKGKSSIKINKYSYLKFWLILLIEPIRGMIEQW